MVNRKTSELISPTSFEGRQRLCAEKEAPVPQPPFGHQVKSGLEHQDVPFPTLVLGELNPIRASYERRVSSVMRDSNAIDKAFMCTV